MRSTDRKIAGVAGGIAEYFGIDPVIVRLAFVVGLFVGGTGLIAYVVAWAVLPNSDEGPDSPGPFGSVDTSTAVALVLLGVAVWVGIADPFDGGFLVPLLLVGGGVYLLNQRPLEQQPPNEVPAAPQPYTSTDATRRFSEPSGFGDTDPITRSSWGQDTVPPAPTDAVAEPRPRRERRQPAVITRLLVSALALLFAGAIAVDQADWLDVDVAIVLAIGLVATGAAAIAGAFVGHSRGMIAVGLVLAAALAVANAVGPVFDDGVGERHHRPTSIDELEPSYQLGIGELEVDLTSIEIPPGEQRRVEVELGIGEARVLLPDGLTVEVTGDLDIGDLDILGLHEEGIGNELRANRSVAGTGTLIIDLQVGIGHGEVRNG